MSAISLSVNVLLQMMHFCLHSKLTNDRANEGKNAKRQKTQNSNRAEVSDRGTVYRLRGHFVPASADDSRRTKAHLGLAFYCFEKKNIFESFCLSLCRNSEQNHRRKKKKNLIEPI